MQGACEVPGAEHPLTHPVDAARTARVISYQTARDVPMDQARALLGAHTSWAYGKFRDLGAPDFDVSAHLERFFDEFDKVLPPQGAYFLALDQSGAAVGTGALKRVSPSTGEMKHLYVAPEWRGTGLGRRLIKARIAAAPALGITTLVADTFQGNAPMIGLYRELGFEDCAPYDSAVAQITPELIPHLKYFRMAL